MPNTQGSDIRYKVIDRCLSSNIRYSMQDIIDACNEELSIHGYKVKSKATIFNDFAHIDNLYHDARTDGRTCKNTEYSIIECDHVGKERYYRYWKKSFSIYKLNLSDEERAGIAQVISFLTRFKGMPQYKWLDDMIAKFSESSDLNADPTNIVGYDENPDLKGRNAFSPLFNCIVKRKPIELTYRTFKDDNDKKLIIHPWYLKQFNKRWFLFGWNQSEDRFGNYAFDRIVEFRSYKTEYIENEIVKFDDFFKSMIGVTRHLDSEPQAVRLWVSPSTWPYVRTKPFHHTQRIIEESDSGTIIEFDVILNYELEQSILYQGENVKVLAPERLKEKISARVQKMFEIYR